MIAQYVIAGAVALTGAAQVILPLFSPINDRPTRLVVAWVFLAVAITGFLVCRWDRRERQREIARASQRHPSGHAPESTSPE